MRAPTLLAIATTPFMALVLAWWLSPARPLPPPLISAAPMRVFHRGDPIPADLYAIVGCPQSELRWGVDITFAGSVGFVQGAGGSIFYVGCNSMHAIMGKNGTTISAANINLPEPGR
jgi:hypothetical protein